MFLTHKVFVGDEVINYVWHGKQSRPCTLTMLYGMQYKVTLAWCLQFKLKLY